MNKLDFGCNVFLAVVLMGVCIVAIWNEKLMIAWCSNTVLWAFMALQMFGLLNEKLDKLIKDKEDETHDK